MAKVTILKAGGRFVAEGDIEVADPGSHRIVEAAGRAVCAAKKKSFPVPAIVRVQEFRNRWRTLAEVVVGE